jgi:hypothetical protein
MKSLGINMTKIDEERVLTTAQKKQQLQFQLLL